MDQELWKKAVDFHGHQCPGIAIGVRASQEAIKALNLQFSKDEKVFCISENKGCPVDGIQVVFGCSPGKGNLIFRNSGKQAFSFFNRNTGESIRLVLKDLPEMERDELESFILNEKDASKIFEFKKPHYGLPEKTDVFENCVCEVCHEKTSEHLVRLKDGKKICLDCSSSIT